jgi:hypothetical protein
MAQASKCANGFCSAVCQHGEGKLFRLDIRIADAAGGRERKMLYLWLCPRCAARMNPKVEVAAGKVTVLLASNQAISVQRRGPSAHGLN